MSSESQMLVEAEQAVQQVLQAASQLEARAAAHGSAQQNLDTARGDLADLARELSKCASSLASAAELMTSAGTPQLLSRMAELSETHAVRHREMTDLIGTEASATRLEAAEHAKAVSSSITKSLEAEFTQVKVALRRSSRQMWFVILVAILAVIAAIASFAIELPQVKNLLMP